MRLILKNGKILSADNQLVNADILIENGTLIKIGKINDSADQVIDVRGNFISAGFIDMHIHLREPGFVHKETIETGTKAAARGGFTTVACMPNTKPPIDTPEIVQEIIAEAIKVNKARVLPIAAITKRQLGENLTDMEALKGAGAVAVSDDGVGVQNSRIMKEAMLLAHSLDLPVVAHCEDNDLAKGGAVHKGNISLRLGIAGIPSEAESIHVGRDILLAEDIGVHYHVCHISTEQSVRLVREAKQRGQNVTAEVTPHHLLLCENDIPGPDPMFKMNPPLRSNRDQIALLEGLMDGTIDIIATDHAPHATVEKAEGMERAPFGIVGLETAFPLLYTHLVQTGKLTLSALIAKLTVEPARIFGLPYGHLAVGEIADLTVIDLDNEQEIRPDQFMSKGQNTPFAGWKLQGWPVLTLLQGQVTYQEKRF